MARFDARRAQFVRFIGLSCVVAESPPFLTGDTTENDDDIFSFCLCFKRRCSVNFKDGLTDTMGDVRCCIPFLADGLAVSASDFRLRFFANAVAGLDEAATLGESGEANPVFLVFFLKL